MLDIERGQHPFQLFMYGSEDCHHVAIEIEVDSPIVQQIKHSILQANPDTEMSCFLCNEPPGVTYALDL